MPEAKCGGTAGTPPARTTRAIESVWSATMRRILAGELREHVDETVRIAGWLHRQRQLSRVTFLVVRDRSGMAQVVVGDRAQAERLAQLAPETVVSVTGSAVAAEQAPGGVEIHEPDVEVVARPAEAPPLELWRPALAAQLPTRLDLAPLALRHPREQATFRVAAASIAGFRAALDELGFTEIQTPKIVASATESGANVFAIDYFGRPAYLAQSPQFYKQAMVGVFERVYETGPVFRAEPHDTPRHLSEYVSLDAELGFVDDHTDVMAVAREAVAGMLAGVERRAGDAAALLRIDLPRVPPQIPAVHFADAQAMIAAATGEDLAGEPDLAPAHERWLGEWARREHDSDFVFVTGYPMAKRPFYTHPDPARPQFSNSFDLLFRGLELITGGQRLHLYEDYVAALAARREDPLAYESYLQAFRYGMPPHGGFAIGLERWVSRLIGAANVRETTLFPRDRNRLTP
jgi:nondiscriminating aspartyl-tRNA synthetase